jgi:hypothetical protein
MLSATDEELFPQDAVEPTKWLDLPATCNWFLPPCSGKADFNVRGAPMAENSSTIPLYPAARFTHDAPSAS